MDHLPAEMLGEIITRVIRPALTRTILVSRLWQTMTLKEIVPIVTKKDFKRACQKGDQLSIARSKDIQGWLREGLFRACKGGQLELAKWLTEQFEATPTDWNYALKGACMSGDHSLIDWIFSKSQPDLAFGLYGACLRNDIPTIERMLTLSKEKKGLNMGLYAACWKGYPELIDRLLELGADDLDQGLYGASKNGDPKLIQMMLDKGATDIDRALCGACAQSRYQIVDSMIAKGANRWNDAFIESCKRGDRKLVDLLMLKGANDWNRAMLNATLRGHREIVDLLIDKPIDLQKALSWACDGDHLELVQFFIEKLKEKGISEWKFALEGACYSGNLGIIKWLIEKGTTNWNAGLSGACFNKRKYMIRYMIKKGANWCPCGKTIEEHLR